MREITHIVIHCSATPPDSDIGADTIRKWHKDKGWEDIGYHYVIRRNGQIESGRALEKPGAHVQGHNAKTVGICLVGGVDKNLKAEKNYTDDQWASLETLVRDMTRRFPNAEVLGHRDFAGVKKACPCFNVRNWWKG